MDLDLRKFRKISSDEKKTVLEHPRGHQITVAHDALTPKMRGQLHSLPMAKGYDAGGSIGTSSGKDININISPSPQISSPPQQEPNLSDQFNNIKQPVRTGRFAAPTIGEGNIFTNPMGVTNVEGAKNVISDPDSSIDQKTDALQLLNKAKEFQDTSDQQMKENEAAKVQAYNAQAQKAGLAPMPTANNMVAQNGLPAPNVQPMAPGAAQSNAIPQDVMNDPYGLGQYMQTYGKGLQEQRAGIMGEAQATGAMGKEQAQQLAQGIQQQQQTQKSYQDHYNELDQERKSFQQDIQNQHIDPQHYLNSMGTGQKISTAIGLILGGMGGGLMHQENPALKFLNSQISNDIDAQKANLGKSENLLNANLRQFGNLKDATDMTRVMQNDIVSNQLKEAAAKATDPLAKARAMQAIGTLDQQSAGIISQLTMKRTMLNGVNDQGADPAVKIRNLEMMGMIKPEQSGQMYKDLASAQELNKVRENALSAFQKLIKIDSVSGRIESPVQSAKQIKALMGPITAKLSKDTAGRFTEQDYDILAGIWPKPGDTKETTAIKLKQIDDLLSEKMNFPSLTAWGINLASNSRFAPGGQKKIQLGAPVPVAQR